MKTTILALIITISISLQSQTLYKGLKEGMSKDAVKKEWKQNKEELQFQIEQTEWRLIRGNIYFLDGELKQLIYYPRGAGIGTDYNWAKFYMNEAVTYYLNNGYEILLKSDYWNAPALFTSMNLKYCIILTNRDHAIHLYFRENRGSYLIYKSITSLEYIVKQIK
jgi:hypothetical protein